MSQSKRQRLFCGLCWDLDLFQPERRVLVVGIASNLMQELHFMLRHFYCHLWFSSSSVRPFFSGLRPSSYFHDRFQWFLSTDILASLPHKPLHVERLCPSSEYNLLVLSRRQRLGLYCVASWCQGDRTDSRGSESWPYLSFRQVC